MKPDNIENCMSDRESPKWDDIGKRYREKKPGEEEWFWITLEVIELAIESEWGTYQENSEENKALPENWEIFFYFREVVTTKEWDNGEECDEDKLGKMSERFPVAGKKENQPCTEKQCSEDRNDKRETPRASISLLCLYISEHDLILFLCDNLTREPAIEEGVDIHKRNCKPLESEVKRRHLLLPYLLF